MLDGRLEPDAKREAWRFRKTPVRACPRISSLLQIRARTRTRIDETALAQRVERFHIYKVALALPYERRICGESEPGEILEDRVLIFPAASLAVVIFNP